MPKGVYDRTLSKPQPRRKFFHDKAWLEHQYLVLEKSTKDIGKELGMRFNAVNRWLCVYGIPLRERQSASRKKRKFIIKTRSTALFRSGVGLTDDLLRQYVVDKKSPNQIACLHKSSWDSVRKRIIRLGLSMRKKDARGVRGKRTGAELKRFQKLLLRHYGYSCMRCGYDRLVNCCHVIPRSDGGEDTIENGIVLCPNCHYEFDDGIIPVEEIRKLQTQQDKEKVRSSE